MGELLKQKQLPTEFDHCLCWVPYEELRGNLFVHMQNWALDQCWKKYGVLLIEEYILMM